MANEPFVKVTTIDQTGRTAVLDDSLVIVQPIISDVGPVGLTKLNSISDLIDKYLISDEVLPTDHPTILHAAKLLQTTPIYALRVVNSSVLEGRSCGDNQIFCDKHFNLLQKSTKLVITHNAPAYPVLYVAITNADATKALFYSGDDSAIPDSVIESHGGAEGATTHEITLATRTTENFFSALNAALTTASLPTFASISITNDYINVVSHINQSIDAIHDDVDTFKVGTITNKFPQFTVSNTQSAYDNNQSRYINLDGTCYHLNGLSPNDTIYPSNPVAIDDIVLERYVEESGTYVDESVDTTDAVDLGLFLMLFANEVISRDTYTVYTNTATLSRAFSIDGHQSLYSAIAYVGSDTQKGYFSSVNLAKNVSEVTTFTIGANGTSGEETLLTNFGIYFTGATAQTDPNKSYYFFIGTPDSVKLASADVAYRLPSCTPNVFVHIITTMMKKLILADANYADARDDGKFASVGFTSTYASSSTFAFITSGNMTLTTNLETASSTALSITSPTSSYYRYTISDDVLNHQYDSYDNMYVKITANGTPYVFRTGTYTKLSGEYDVNMDPTGSAHTYSSFMTLLRSNVASFITSLISVDSFTLFTEEEYATEDHSSQFTVTKTTQDYQSVKTGDRFTVVLKDPSVIDIGNFSITRDTVDSEIYHITLTYNDVDENYDISFSAGKTDGYGNNLYFTYVNDISTRFHIVQNNTTSHIPQSFTGTLFGGLGDMQLSVSDAITTLNTLNDIEGQYFDIIWNGGYEDAALISAIDALGVNLYSTNPASFPPNYVLAAQLEQFRNSVGVDSWETRFFAPYCKDTTLGDFVAYLSPAVYYIERIVQNKMSGKEFAPPFSKNNGIVNGVPSREITKTDRELLLDYQINTIKTDKISGASFFNNERTAQRTMSALSNDSAARMANAIAHVADYQAEFFLSRFNDVQTRMEATTNITEAIKARVITGQQYKPYAFRVVCNESNNPLSVIENEQLVIDVYVQFLPGIKEVHVYQRVVRLNQNLAEI